MSRIDAQKTPQIHHSPAKPPKADKKVKTQKPPAAVAVHSGKASANAPARPKADENWLRNLMTNTFAAKPPKREFPSVHIPPGKERHDGKVSKYDILPPTNRNPGEPDRYRAVNPNFIVRRDGTNYYKMRVKPGAHYFDSNLKVKGEFKDRDVEIDFTRKKTITDKDGNKETYVFARGKGYVRLKALTDGERTEINGPADLRKTEMFKFDLTRKKGGHELYDGTGNSRGVVTADSVKINYGSEKIIKGERYYYAFATRIDTDGRGKGQDPIGASGWIKASALKDEPVSGNPPKNGFGPRTLEINNGQAPPKGTSYKEYTITGGDIKEKFTSGEMKGKYKFGFVNKKGEFETFKVLPGSTEKREAAGDYLTRDGDVVNLGINVAGRSNDTISVKPGERTTFHRASGEGTTATIDLYYPKGDGRAGEKPVRQMKFVYGYIEYQGEKNPDFGKVPNAPEFLTAKRYGWIPLDALQAK